MKTVCQLDSGSRRRGGRRRSPGEGSVERRSLTRSTKRNLKSSRPNKRSNQTLCHPSGRGRRSRECARDEKSRRPGVHQRWWISRSGRTRNGTRLARRLLVPASHVPFKRRDRDSDEKTEERPSLSCKRSCDRNSKETNEIALVIFDRPCSPLYERHLRVCLYQNGRLIPSIGPSTSSDLKSALRTAPDHDSRKPRDPRVATILHHGFGCGRRRAGTIDDPNGTDCNWP